MDLLINMQYLPPIYWIPKMHKNLISFIISIFRVFITIFFFVIAIYLLVLHLPIYLYESFVFTIFKNMDVLFSSIYFSVTNTVCMYIYTYIYACIYMYVCVYIYIPHSCCAVVCAIVNWLEKWAHNQGLLSIVIQSHFMYWDCCAIIYSS